MTVWSAERDLSAGPVSGVVIAGLRGEIQPLRGAYHQYRQGLQVQPD
jgi:hypothetical protein